MSVVLSKHSISLCYNEVFARWSILQRLLASIKDSIKNLSMPRIKHATNRKLVQVSLPPQQSPGDTLTDISLKEEKNLHINVRTQGINLLHAVFKRTKLKNAKWESNLITNTAWDLLKLLKVWRGQRKSIGQEKNGWILTTLAKETHVWVAWLLTVLTLS